MTTKSSSQILCIQIKSEHSRHIFKHIMLQGFVQFVFVCRLINEAALQLHNNNYSGEDFVQVSLNEKEHFVFPSVCLSVI